MNDGDMDTSEWVACIIHSSHNHLKSWCALHHRSCACGSVTRGNARVPGLTSIALELWASPPPARPSCPRQQNLTNSLPLSRRTQIIALANLRKKATHSTQTALSHFRRDGDTQTWAPKQAISQTPVTKGQAMPKKLRYVAGLRGAPGTKMNVVSLELELGQPHQF